MRNGFAGILILVGILVIAGLAGGVYYLGTHKSATPVASPNPVVTSISQPASPTSPIPDETANWQTYQSTNGKYSIKYPSDIITIFSKDQKGNVLFELVKDKNTSIGAYGNWPISLSIDWRGNPGASAEQALFQEGLNNCISPCNKKDQEVPVTINSAVGFARKDVKDDYYLTNKDQTDPVFRVSFSYQDGKYTGASNEVKIFRQMLQTFTFANQIQTTDTSSWKIYTSKSGNYSFNYPNDWQLTEKINPNLNKIIPVVSIFTPGSFDTNPDFSGAGENIAIIVYNNPSNLKLEDFIKATINNDQYTFNFVPVTIADTNGEKLINTPGAFENEFIYVAKGSNVYLIDWLKGQSKQPPISKAQFNQILSTFKFTQ